MIVAALLVIGLITFKTLQDELSERDQSARVQGLDLARLLSSMPWQQLVNSTDSKSFQQVIDVGQNHPDFAYGLIVDNQGTRLSEVTAPGIITPEGALPRVPADWLGQRELADSQRSMTYLETHAPLFDGQGQRGFVRLGYIKPSFHLDLQQIPTMAMVSLPIFLLIPLFYFFLRRELLPLKALTQRIETFSEETLHQSVELKPNSQLSDFIQQFNSFMTLAEGRMQELDNQQDEMMVTGRLLAYQNNKVESILKALPEAILVVDQGGQITYANDRSLDFVDGEDTDLKERQPAEWCNSEELLHLLKNSHSKNQVIQLSADAFKSSRLTADQIFEVRNYPLFSPREEHEILGQLVVIRDITDQLNETKRQVEFITQVSHELKTPLHVLSMYSEVLLDPDLATEVQRVEAANVIHDEVERLATLIQNLLDIARLESSTMQVERQRVRLRDFLEDIFNQHTGGKNNKDVRFDLDLPSEMSAVYIDKALIRIAVNNLMTNAIKYNKPGGSVSLTATESDYYIDITVSDEGYGISAEDQASIFNKFFRSEDPHIREQTGHGLGLSLSSEIVQLHQGELLVSSEPMEGSQFTIRLEKAFASGSFLQ